MNRLLLAIVILSAGAFGFASLHQTTVQTVSKTMADQAVLRATTNRLAAISGDILTLRDEVKDRKHHLQQLQAGLGDHPGLDDSSEPGKKPGNHRSALAGLREEWRMGWNDSKDYVLVDKEALKDINFQPVDFGNRVTDSGRTLLGITPEEEVEVNQTIRRTLAQHDDWVRAHLMRSEPSGDVIARYTVLADPTLEQNLFNEFSQNIVRLLGSERADIFLESAWNQMRQAWGGGPKNSDNILILRHSLTEPNSKLTYEWINGSSSSPQVLEYGSAPPQPFRTVFPSYLDIARREGFGLSKDFHYLPNGQ